MALPNKQLGLHSKKFADKVKVMNQTNSKEIMLTALEARNLLNDIVDLMSHIVSLSTQTEKEQSAIHVKGGNF